MRSSLDNANEQTRQAQQKAMAATSTANQALTMAKADQTAIAKLNDKLDRMDKASHKSKPKAAPKAPSTSSPPASSAGQATPGPDPK
jgi:hypothetical protein